jgi:hypothetical protein
MVHCGKNIPEVSLVIRTLVTWAFSLVSISNENLAMVLE